MEVLAMARVLIVYAGDYGNTEKMADACAEGVDGVEGVEALVKHADKVRLEDMRDSDGVIIGSPVHMGCMDWRIKKMIDGVCSGLWMQDMMNGKVAGVFATGSGYGGAGCGCELTMLSILNNMAELGMLIVPLPKITENFGEGGLQWGPYGRSAGANMEHIGVSEEVLSVARVHGANIARAALAIKGSQVFID